MTDKRITQTNPGFVGPRRRWYDKIRDEFNSLGKELEVIASAYSTLEQRIQPEESAPKFLPTPESAISFAYAVAQQYAHLEKLPELLQKYTLPLARHLKDVKTDKGGPDKELQRRGERICEDLMEWKRRFEVLYESQWYKKGLHTQIDELLELARDEKPSPEKRLKRIKKCWTGGILSTGIKENLGKLFDLVEDLSVYELVLHQKIDEKYGQPFEKLSKRWEEKKTI